VDLPVDIQSTATAAVAQAPAPVAGAAATVGSAVRPTTRQVSVPAVDAAAALPESGVAAGEYTAAAARSVIADGPAEPGADPPARLARFHRRGHVSTRPGRAHRDGRAAAVTHHPVTAPASNDAAHRTPSRAAASDAKDRPTPSHRAPSTPESGVASAPSAGLSLGGLALLAVGVCLAGPRLRRRLAISPVAIRSVAFVSLLERPG
jgi:hypothetical protein